MIPKNLQQAIVEEFIAVCNDPVNRGKFIAVATIIRRIENRHGYGVCRGVDEDELRKFIKDASGL